MKDMRVKQYKKNKHMKLGVKKLKNCLKPKQQVFIQIIN